MAILSKKHQIMNAWIIPGLKEKPIYNRRIQTKIQVIEIVLNYFNITMEDLTKKSRSRELVIKRYVMAYCLKKHADQNLCEIARILRPGISNHTTVMYGLALIEGQLTSPFQNSYREHIENINL
jgi:chromosomal replication initiation ATPase DnaA